MNFKLRYIKLSQHLVLEDVCKTNHKDLEQANLEWGLSIRDSLKKTAIAIYEPLFDIFRSFYITSGARCPVLNDRVGHSKQHEEGRAFDMCPQAKEVTCEEVFNYMLNNPHFKCGQVIFYPENNFIHVSRFDIKYYASHRDFRICRLVDGKRTYEKITVA